uniref:Uncharacterized protein n=1 Tax=Pinguiococcus pyrenoidosus TaxID=172671 RepID=A0A7R9YC40_9STRA|mmetsp:Transcript_17403/g.66296  ORF Transcript_17403/g.66296 Transcript_17403/m.66296 type:complete len:417 (+) Transcript_17403:236-1486(+)
MLQGRGSQDVGRPRRLSLLVHLSCAAVASSSNSKRKPVAYIHIGHWKVASTSIQSYVCDKSHLLADEYNLALLMPEKCWTSHYCRDYGLAFARRISSCGDCSPIPNDKMESGWGRRAPLCHADDGGAVPEARQAAADALAAGRDVFFSSEYFEVWNPRNIAYLQDVLKGFELRILLMLRHPLTWMVSGYAQRWKKGRTHEVLSEVVENAKESQGQAAGFMNRTIQTIVEPLPFFIDALGADKVFVGSLDGMIQAGMAPAIAVLQAFCGRNTSALISPGHPHNASPSPFAMEMVEFIRRFAAKRGEDLGIPRWPQSNQEEFVQDLQKLADVLGAKIWECHDYVDDFVPTELELTRAVKKTGATRLFFDEDALESDAPYFHMRTTEVCHGAFEALFEDKAKSQELLVELKKFKDKWEK